MPSPPTGMSPGRRACGPRPHGDRLLWRLHVGDCPILVVSSPYLAFVEQRRGVVKKQLAICAGLLLLGFGTVGPAGAQTVYAGPDLDSALPPFEIMSIVRSTGLAPLTRPMRRGPYYVLVAVDRVGRQMRVVVDAQLGDIVNLRPALAAGLYGPELGRPNGLPAAGAPPPDPTAAYGSHPSAEPAAPTPPRSIPNPRTATAPNNASPPLPTRLAVAEPALPPPPPLPRPRPKLALNETPAQPPAAAPAANPSAPVATSPTPAPDGAGEAGKPIE